MNFSDQHGFVEIFEASSDDHSMGAPMHDIPGMAEQGLGGQREIKRLKALVEELQASNARYSEEARSAREEVQELKRAAYLLRNDRDNLADNCHRLEAELYGAGKVIA